MIRRHVCRQADSNRLTGALIAPLALVPLVLVAVACGATAQPSVVIYTSVDQNFAEPLLGQFEQQTGIDVQAVYDVEAAKTTGLVNRLLAEKDRPRADVWWSGEFAQTIELAEKGVLAAYESPAAADIPEQYRDPRDRWTGVGGRARVFLVNTDLVAAGDEPRSVNDLLTSAVPGDQIGLAYPVFGTAATHAAALYAALGDAPARRFFEDVAARGVRIVDGNSVVRDMVAAGQLAFGLTDTDDACGAIARGAPVKVVIPDQEPGGTGTLIVPNTVALVAGGPHLAQGQQLVDYLVSPATEKDMVTSDWIQVALRDVGGSSQCALPADVRGMDVSLTEVAAKIGQAKADMATIFVR